MAYKIFTDTNVFLDHLLQRTPNWEFARELFVLAEQKEIAVCTSSSSLVNILYALKQQKKLTYDDIVTLMGYLLSYTKIAHTDEQAFKLALVSGFTDLEDAIQYYTALADKDIDYFITSNIKDYKKALPQLRVITPKQFMILYKKKG